MPTVVVAGALANKAGSGGEAWVRMSWVRGFQQLGADVWFVEQALEPSDAEIAYFDRTVDEFHLAARAALVTPDGAVRGPDVSTLADVAGEATLVNISGHLDAPALFGEFRRRVYVDIDPGFTQAWCAAGLGGHRLDGHDVFATIGEGIGQPECPIPTCGREWLAVRQPVVLDDWPAVAGAGRSTGFDRFTTVASWRGPFGPVTIGGETFGSKVHEFRKILALPQVARHRFELALAIHPGDAADHTALEAAGWDLVDPGVAAGSAAAFRAYVQGSSAEFSVAQGVYVHTASGWFSDRTVRYLACGRPALVQDTGFTRRLPSGTGLLAFGTLAEAAAGADDIVQRYDEHCAAARAIAEQHFDAAIVLARFCEQCGIG